MSDRPLTPFERLEHVAAKALNRLPPRAQVLLAGGKPIVRDGLTLHPELQLLLAVRERMGARAMSHGSPGEARRRLRREALVHAGVPEPVREVKDLTVTGAAGPLKARHYRPEAEGDAPSPMLLFFHGGGFVVGDLDTHDSLCRMLCRHGRMQVLSVEYRKAPEEPFPAAVEDVRASYAWTLQNAASLGVHARKIAVGGDSAGGNLAAVHSVRAVREGAPAPALQLLLYPALDRKAVRRSLELFAEGFFLTRADIEWFQEQYTGTVGADCTDPLISPLHCGELAGLPPALIVTAGFDPLRDEAEAYVEALQQAGSRAVLRRYDGFIHGFANMTGVSRACRLAVIEIAQTTRHMLEAGSA